MPRHTPRCHTRYGTQHAGHSRTRRGAARHGTWHNTRHSMRHSTRHDAQHDTRHGKQHGTWHNIYQCGVWHTAGHMSHFHSKRHGRWQSLASDITHRTAIGDGTAHGTQHRGWEHGARRTAHGTTRANGMRHPICKALHATCGTASGAKPPQHTAHAQNTLDQHHSPQSHRIRHSTSQHHIWHSARRAACGMRHVVCGMANLNGAANAKRHIAPQCTAKHAK